MAWVKVDDQFTFHPKIVASGNEAIGLWIRAAAWTAGQLQGGFVPKRMAHAIANGMAGTMAASEAIASLVEAGLWIEVDGGYRFHDWDDYQPSAEEERAKREARSRAGKLGAASRWGTGTGKTASNQTATTRVTHAITPAITNTPETITKGQKGITKLYPDPDPLIKDLCPSGAGAPTAREKLDHDFDDWYRLYPRKVGKGKAVTAYRTARKKTDAASLLAALQAQMPAWAGRESQFIPYPASWLNAERWSDGDTAEGAAADDPGWTKPAEMPAYMLEPGYLAGLNTTEGKHA